MSSENKTVFHSSARFLVLLIATISLPLTAQTPASAVIDLTSPALKAHADLPQYFRAGPPVAQLLAEAKAGAGSKGIAWKGLDFVVSDANTVAGFTPAGVQQTYTKLACSADTIAMGHVTASAPHFSTYGVVYTDYVFAVDQLFLDRQVLAPSQSPATQMIVTRKGGALMLNGDSVNYRFESSPDLQPGQVYLLFLRSLPQTSAYQTLDSFSTLQKSGQNWILSRMSTAPVVPGITADNFGATLKTWRNSCK